MSRQSKPCLEAAFFKTASYWDVLLRLLPKDKNAIKSPEQIAPKKAPADKIEIPKKENRAKKTAKQIAPSVAPLDIPIRPGSASEFLKNNWNIAPVPASSAPEINTKAERGRRSLYKINFPVSVDKSSCSVPRKRLTANAAAKITVNAKKTAVCFTIFLFVIFIKAIS